MLVCLISEHRDPKGYFKIKHNPEQEDKFYYAMEVYRFNTLRQKPIGIESAREGCTLECQPLFFKSISFEHKFAYKATFTF